MENINRQFGQRVSDLRKQRGLTQVQFAIECNLNPTYMGEVERGEKSPSLQSIEKIARGLGIPLRDLFDF